TGDKTGANRVVGRRDHDRNDRCRLLCSDSCWSCRRNNEIDLELDELGRNFDEALVASLRPAVLDRNIAILNPTELAQPLQKGSDPLALNQRRRWDHESDRRQLLRARRKGPRGSAAKQRDELAPPHSITSSARPSSGSGTVRPSALAVLRLIISSTLVACCT